VSCETRLNPNGRFQLIVPKNDRERVEFRRLPQLLTREHELPQSWRIRLAGGRRAAPNAARYLGGSA
jgi:hypothetical protein